MVLGSLAAGRPGCDDVRWIGTVGTDPQDFKTWKGYFSSGRLAISQGRSHKGRVDEEEGLLVGRWMW